MKIYSKSFEDGKNIPARYTGEGEDISPELSWGGVPENVRSFALIMDDPDAPAGIFTHWVVFNIPAKTNGLEENASLPAGYRQGITSYGRTGYSGPYPPPGKPHHYRFSLYALDNMLSLPNGASKEQLLEAISGHVLAEAHITGIYER